MRSDLRSRSVLRQTAREQRGIVGQATQKKRAQDGKGDVAQRTRQRDDHLIALGMLEIAKIDGYGFGKCKDGAAGQYHDQGQQYGAEGIDVAKRIERDAALRSSRAIAQKVGGERVGALMHHNADDRGRCACEQAEQIVEIHPMSPNG